MKPVMQTRTVKPGTKPDDAPPEERGNCFAACIASILEVSCDDVDACLLLDDAWWERAHYYCFYAGFALEWRQRDSRIDPPKGYAIAGGRSQRGMMHAVVALDGEIVHDPHPDGGGIESVSDWVTLTPLADYVARSAS